MAVVDRWHLSRPPKDAPECPDHSGKVASPEHGCAERWRVRWRDDQDKQRKKSFAKKSDADRFDAKTTTDLTTGDYIDPNRGKVTLRSYGEQWRASLVADPTTVANVTSRLNKHVYPHIGPTPMGVLAKRPSLIQQWIKVLESAGLGAAYVKGIVGWVSTIFAAAIDDGIVSRNPCAAKTVRRPRVDRNKPVPWSLEHIERVAAELGDRYAAMVFLGAGCGHRQGELFGIGLADVDFLGRVVNVERQVRIVAGELVFSPPKGGKTRSVPLPNTVGLRLSAHIKAYAPVRVTLPWKVPSGDPVAAELLFTTEQGGALERPDFNRLWRAARTAVGIPDGRQNGMHVLRHTAASAWLSSGVDIRTVAEYLGHTDAGFTLRTYTHLMPSSEDRARKAMDAFFASAPSALDVPSGRS